MAIDVSELLLDDTDQAPTGAVSGEAQPAQRRGRGRPKGSRTRSGGASVPARPSAAGARELAKLLAKVIGGGSILLALFIQADEAAMTQQEANDIAKPAARLLAKTKLGEWIMGLFLAGESLGGDAGKLTWALVMYGIRIYPLIVLRKQQLDAAKHAQEGRPFGNGLTPEDAGLRAAQPAQATASQPSGSQAGARADNAADAARAAADAARFGGLGFSDPDALAAGSHGDVAALVRAYPAD